MQNLVVHHAVSFNSASLKVLFWTNGRLPLSSQATREIPRPISLLSIISKVMETVVNKQLLNHLLNNKLISSRQFGFRPHHGTADLLTILAQTWNAYLDRNKEVSIVVCDIKGAFDRV